MSAVKERWAEARRMMEDHVDPHDVEEHLKALLEAEARRNMVRHNRIGTEEA